MSQEQSWMYEEMGRAMLAERLADAERYRIAVAARGPRETPRMMVAKALRSLATLLDGNASAPAAQPDRQFVRSLRAV